MKGKQESYQSSNEKHEIFWKKHILVLVTQLAEKKDSGLKWKGFLSAVFNKLKIFT